VGDERGCDGGVVVPEVALRHAVLGEEHAVGAGEAHLALSPTEDTLLTDGHLCRMPGAERRRPAWWLRRAEGVTKPA
jgi:hypothetical protein